MAYKSVTLGSASLSGLLLLVGAMAAQLAAAAPEAGGEPDAKAILMSMAKSLAETPRFSVNLRSGYDSVQESGQKIEFLEKRKVVVNRPSQLRVEVERSDADAQLVLFDGKDITVESKADNVYAQVNKPGTIDDAVAYFLRDLKMRLPLALMLVSKLPDELQRRVSEVDYVEETKILGVPAHHLAARTETVDFQIWISEGEQPVPLRVVLTYKTEAGLPQFWADFADWNRAPEVTDATFSYVQPKDARKIPFLTQVAQVGSPGVGAPAASGAQTKGDSK